MAAMMYHDCAVNRTFCPAALMAVYVAEENGARGEEGTDTQRLQLALDPLTSLLAA